MLITLVFTSSVSLRVLLLQLVHLVACSNMICKDTRVFTIRYTPLIFLDELDACTDPFLH